MEEEIRPQVISSIEFLVKNYAKLMKYQNEKLECALNAKEFSKNKRKSYLKILEDIINKIKSLQLNPSVLEELVQENYQENNFLKVYVLETEKKFLKEKNILKRIKIKQNTNLDVKLNKKVDLYVIRA